MLRVSTAREYLIFAELFRFAAIRADIQEWTSVINWSGKRSLKGRDQLLASDSRFSTPAGTNPPQSSCVILQAVSAG
jgi:hypothetical protein